MKSYATTLLILSTLSGMHAAPTTRLDSSLVTKDTKITVRHGTKENPLQSLYIRNGVLVGDKLGHFNDSIAKNGPMDLGINMTHLSIHPQPDFSYGDLNINLLTDSLGVAVLAALFCAGIPGCPAYIAANLGFATTAAAVETITAATSAVKRNEDTLVKRDDAEDEKWACTVIDGWSGACYNQAITPGYVQAIANADAAASSWGSTYWQMTSADTGEAMANWYHCTIENGDCALVGDGAPTVINNIGSAAGH